ncbi:MAG: GGDEF domain-containing protein [Suilimivivens sp.]
MMNSLNITDYKNEDSEIKIYYARGSIKNGYYIVNGDEYLYYFLGNSSFYSVPELLHPEDVACFMEAVQRLDQQPQRLILRMKCITGEYKYLYMVLKYNGKIFDGFRSFDMELCDIMAIRDKFVEYSDQIEKYREFMTLFPFMFFEYEFGTDVFQIYEYRNRHSYRIYYDTLEATDRRVNCDENLSAGQKAEFRILYESLKKGRDYFKTDIDAVVLQENAVDIRYEFKMSTIYKEDIRDKVVGIVSTISEAVPKKSYYLSENAFDLGTGLLNKRAIHEYALEKIQNQTAGLYLAIVDIDDFKKINDGFGHMFGDEVISKVAEIIRSVVKARGVAGRFGGDEFMIVFERINSEATLRRILSTIAKHVEWTFVDKEGLSATLSFGISKYPEDGTTYEELFKKADKCVYIAKAKGKNRYIIYDEKKHGLVKKEEAFENIGFRTVISDEKKNTIVSEIVLSLYQKGREALLSAMEKMQRCFNMDGIALYVGKDMHRILSVGDYVNPVENLDFIFEKTYLDFFDEQHFYEENRIWVLENKVPAAYERYKRQETEKFIQCVSVDREGVPVAVVSFDFFNRSPKFGTTDIGLVRIAGRLMAEITATLG